MKYSFGRLLIFSILTLLNSCSHSKTATASTLSQASSVYGRYKGYSNRTVNGNKISFADLHSNMMACEISGEPVYFQTLKTVTSFNINNNNMLTSIIGDIGVMRCAKK